MAHTLIITKSHPRLSWLAETNRNRRVPPHVAREMSSLDTIDRAQAFVAGAGLMVQARIRRVSDSANAVSLAPPEGFNEYYGPQVVLPRIDLELIPSGTALMNCLLPEITDPASAEQVFKQYQEMVLTFAGRVEALPFACITGCATKDPLHDLHLRSFRFFFGPQPDAFFPRISETLQTWQALYDNSNRSEKVGIAEKIQELKVYHSPAGKIGHSLLEDIKSTLGETVLVDLRDA